MYRAIIIMSVEKVTIWLLFMIKIVIHLQIGSWLTINVNTLSIFISYYYMFKSKQA